jgi:hypothetical protein
MNEENKYKGNDKKTIVILKKIKALIYKLYI